MKSFPPELIYVLIFVAIMLFQFIMKKLGQNVRQEQQEFMPDEDLSEYPEEPAEIAAAPSAVFSKPKPADGTFNRAATPKPVQPLARRRFSRRSLMGTRRKMQNAVVIASILGPCRAFEPHDKR